MAGRVRGGRGRSEHGAALVEYALAVAGVVVVAASAIGSFETESTKRLESRTATAGAPDIDEAPVTSPPGSVPTASPTTTTTTAPASVLPSVSLTGATATANGNRWTATVRVVLVDLVTGAPLTGALVSGLWSPAVGFPTSCQVTTSGACTMTQTQKDSDGLTATFTVTGVTGPNLTYVLPVPSPSLVLVRP